jgi:hypothetical protein
MYTKKWTTLSAAIALIATPMLYTENADASEVSSAQRSISVKYRNGNVERYHVIWTADVAMDVHEDGGPSKPFEGHPIDDRRCRWGISGSISREVYLVSQTGLEYASRKLARVYNKAQANEGASFLLAGLRSENCNDAAGRRNSDLQNMVRQVLGDFTGTVDSDFGAVKRELKQDAGVLKVESSEKAKSKVK